MGEYKSEITNRKNVTRKIHIGEYESQTSHRRIHIENTNRKNNSGNINQKQKCSAKQKTNRSKIGKYNSEIHNW